MTVNEKKAIIKEHPLFNGLKNDALDFIAVQVQDRVYEPNTIILRQGDDAKAVYFIYKGLVKIYEINNEGKQIPVKIIGEKDFVGDLGAFDGGSIPATVETIQNTYTLFFTKEQFKHLISKYPVFALNVLESWAKKVRIINQQRENIYSLQLKERVLFTLNTLAPYFPNKQISLSQEELANIVGASRARVTEVLSELEKQKIIITSSRNIKIL